MMYQHCSIFFQRENARYSDSQNIIMDVIILICEDIFCN